MVRVRIVQKGKNTCIVEYKNREYTVNTSDLVNVNAGWTYGFISSVYLV